MRQKGRGTNRRRETELQVVRQKGREIEILRVGMGEWKRHKISATERERLTDSNADEQRNKKELDRAIGKAH